ncbi:MAG: phosphoribosylaminoimidazolesuccinocarboxamide synthase, partial [Candidatus Accumulibacter sp.]|nr:phosphoribosylaminoimidazolesuccinocarboxamide synthase [Accumulibacter sp.]
AGLPLAARLPEPIFTPATKAEQGAHDENISFEQARINCDVALAGTLEGSGKSGARIAEQAREAAIALYSAAAAYALERGIIIADTKFEFGIDAAGALYLIDEALTPDSSRFWPAAAYRPGGNPPSYDKQYVRDHLEAQGWNKKAPAPSLPNDVIAYTSAKYIGAYEQLTGRKLDLDE